MQTFGVIGGDAAALTDRLLDRLDGRVGVVRPGAGASTDGGRAVQRQRADTVYHLDDGTWRASGSGTLADALDALAPGHDYAVVEDRPDARLPQVVLGGEDHERAFHQAEDADSVDLDALAADADALEPYETLESLVARVKRSSEADRAGAIATFTGRVRAKDASDDERTEYLEFEKYEGVADERMATIAAELEERDGVFEVALHHRTGVVPAGEDIVFVVVLAGHRREAFRTVEDGIDRLKEEVPLFKKEVTEGEEFWVHEK